MSSYRPPVADMAFTIKHVAGLHTVPDAESPAAVDDELLETLLAEAAKLAENVIAPLNHPGDTEGSRLENGVVRTPAGFPQAYRQYQEAGWNSVPFDQNYGGQGLPWTVAFAVQEMWQAANLSFGVCPLLTQGAVEALRHHGSAWLKETFLPRLIDGSWTGTMNLTEPHAGSDVGSIRTRAEPAPDGTFRIRGQKIFISYGDHDMAENLVHLVLARLPDAPSGPPGISLFAVPKFLPGEDGKAGPRNDVRVLSLEAKLGIHASPTCVMAYGEDDGAVGYLVGNPHQGLACMFTMMNTARLLVGLQGVAIADRAFQHARAFAHQRVQGRPVGGGNGPVPIIQHPDIRRMLLEMKAGTEAARALTYMAAAQLDLAQGHPDPERRSQAQARVDFLTPIVKSWGTDLGVDIASLGVQIHGGMGYIEEMGAAQYLRDSRIAPIYEGTNGIQAGDLVFRKLARDRGAEARRLVAEMADRSRRLCAAEQAELAPIGRRLGRVVGDMAAATDHLVDRLEVRPEAAAAGAVPYARLAGIVIGGAAMALAAERACALAAAGNSAGIPRGKLATARYFADHYLPRSASLLAEIVDGADSILAIRPEEI